MIGNYLAVFSRMLVRHRGFSFITIVGLGLGFVCFTLISIYLAYETGFDRFHDGADRLYRVNKIVHTSGGQIEQHALTAGLLAPALVESFAEVESAVRVQPWFDDVLLSIGERAFMTPDVAIVDAGFFDFFGFMLVRGRPDAVLAEPLSIVLTESVGERLFGDSDPIGQTVQGLNNLSYVVTGIAADPNPSSHLRFNALISWSSTLPGAGGLEFDWMNRWITQAPFTYVRLSSGGNVRDLEAMLPAFYASNDPDRAARYTLYLQPIRDVYLHSSDLLYADAARRGSARNLEMFSIVRFLILFIAAINFMNLSVARGASRSREVGIRRVVGAHRAQLTRQFLFESLAYSLLALFVAWLLILAVLPLLSAFAGIPAFEAPPLRLSYVWQGLMLATGVGIFAGLHPALVLSARSAAARLRRARLPGATGATRNAFVVAQFGISMILIAGAFIVFRQLEFMRSSDKGFNAERLIVLNTDGTAMQRQFAAFTNEVKRHPAIVDAAGSNSVPGAATSTFQIAPEGVREGTPQIAGIVRIDDFSLRDTYEFEMAAGRWFDRARPMDESSGVVVNEALVASIGWRDAVGRRLDIVGELVNGRVIGVVKDFHFQSMHLAIAPLAFYYAPRGGTMTVRTAPGALEEAIRHLEATWKAFEPLYPFTYSFLDESFARFYETESRLMNLLGLFSAVALFIACLGLYGMAAYMAATRTKEVGVRKVLGANVPQIVALFVLDLARPVGLAILVATPLVYLGARAWLANFAYRTPVGFDVYAIAAAAVLCIALLSVSWQPVRAALANPVASLRDE